MFSFVLFLFLFFLSSPPPTGDVEDETYPKREKGGRPGAQGSLVVRDVRGLSTEEAVPTQTPPDPSRLRTRRPDPWGRGSCLGRDVRRVPSRHFGTFLGPERNSVRTEVRSTTTLSRHTTTHSENGTDPEPWLTRPDPLSRTERHPNAYATAGEGGRGHFTTTALRPKDSNVGDGRRKDDPTPCRQGGKSRSLFRSVLQPPP